jgi:hypothetical protein
MSALALTRALAVASLLASGTFAGQDQRTDGARPPRKETSGVALTGRVSFSDGSPAASATLSIRAVGENSYTQRSIVPEDDGRFSFGDLQPGVYHVSASAPGYYQADADAENLVRPGDSVSITLNRGGVITGTVTGVDGTPVVGIPVHADPLQARGTVSLNTLDTDGSDKTDDRGIYRIYGLVPGDYVVSAGGAELGLVDSTFSDDVKVYYPSARRQGASTLSVGPGQELTSIDIRYRSERGHVVSGTVAGAFSGQGGFSGALVTLTRVDEGAVEAITIVQGSHSTTFSLKGVADGEYLVAATSGFGLSDRTSSDSKRITVKGADVGNVVLTLEPAGSVAGQVTIEPLGAEGAPGTCGTRRETSPVDVAIIARSIAGASAIDATATQPSEDVPSRRGAFTIKNIRAGTYALDVALDEESLYVSSIVLQRPKPESGPAAPPQDGASGIRVTPGEKVTGVAMHVSRGAGSLKGTVEPRTKGALLPSVAVFMLPLEPENANAALRHRVAVANGREFAFDHVAPGRYAILVRETKRGSLPAPSIQWVTDGALRESLRIEGKAESASIVTIAPCQHVVDQVVRFQTRGAPAR